MVSINQPAYLPWLGYFDRIAASDIHVVLDHVQFEKNSYTNRNKVRTSNGSTWLTVPVITSGKFGGLPINALEIADGGRWARKHWQTIEQNYRHAPYFPEHRDAFAAIYNRPWRRFVDLVDEITTYLLSVFAIDVPLLHSSALKAGGHKSDLVLNICLEVGANVYLSGALGRQYLDENAFASAGVDILYQDYTHPVYPQVHPGFEPAMASIDLLFMQGPQAAKTLRISAPVSASSTVASGR